ncbi:MAG: hypothetical protein M1820_004368 [Bogoriella megaspora]|nr:MAG: hypothetical protein M1820_004368 [Bogoriella megaspora]
MPQGAVKSKTLSQPKKSSTSKSVRGARVIKPKKAVLQKQQNLKKKHSSGLTALTERKLAEKAGHLEMLKGGKKDRKEGDKGKKGTKTG